MSTSHNLWAWPIRFAAPTYVLRVTANSVTENLTFPASGSLDAEADYWMLDDGDTTDSLPKLLELCLESHSEITTVTGALLISDVPTKLTITSDLSISILWTHGSTTLDKSIFGFTTDETGTLITSNIAPQGLWRPRLGAYIDSRPRQPYLGGVTRALSGATRVVQSAVAKKTRDYSYRYLNKTYALDEFALAAEPTNTFEQLQANGVMLGRKLRFCANETDRTTYTEQRSRSLVDTLQIMDAPNLVWWECALETVAV